MALLEGVTLAWNVVGVVVLASVAVQARSVALAGFGLDSLVEIGASAVVLWQLADSGKAQRERVALRLIRAAFLVLAVYLTVLESGRAPVGLPPAAQRDRDCVDRPDGAGHVRLASGKRRVGAALGNPVSDEAQVTVIDGLFATAVLIGLLLNALLGWWWAGDRLRCLRDRLLRDPGEARGITHDLRSGTA